MNNDEIVQLLLQVTGAKSLDDLKEKAQGAKDKLEDLASAGTKAEKSTADFGRSALETGRIVQDFAQGGVGGAVGAMEKFVRAIGGGAGVAGALTLLVAAFVALKEPVGNFVSSMTEGANKVPPLRNAVDQFAESLGRTNKELGELRDKQSLTNQELDRYNELIERQGRLEEAVAVAKKQKSDADKLDALVPRSQAVLQKERVAELQDSIAGRQDDLVREVEDHMLATDPGLAKARARGDRVRVDEYISQIKKYALDNVVSAVIDGSEADLQNVLQHLPKDSKFRSKLEPWQTEVFAERKADEHFRKNQNDQDARLNTYLREAQRKEDADEAKAQAIFDKGQSDYANGLARYEEGVRDARKKKNEEVRRLEEENADAVHESEVAQARERQRAEERAAREAERAAREAARENAPDARLRRMRGQVRETAAGVALRENNGEFNAGELSRIVDMAADAAPLNANVDVIRQYVFQAAVMTRQRMWNEYQTQLNRLQAQGDPNFNYD